MSRIFRPISITRIALVAMLAVTAAFTVQAASAQMMHYELDVTIQTEDGSPIPAGTVCIDSVTGGQTCMDIPDGTPSGRDFLFTGLPSGEHTVTVNAGTYLEAIVHGTAADPAGSVTVTLYMEVTPPANLPNTGAGVTALEASSPLAMLLIAGSMLLATGAGALRLSTRDPR